MTSGVFTIPLISTDGVGRPSSEGVFAAAEPRYFHAGPENQLLGILSNASSAHPPLFNPITLYGPTGVGKSHLLHGVVNRHRTFMSDSLVIVLTGADSARGFARAIEVDSVAEWREKLRRVDLFALDDLQELSSKPAAQQELAYTLDALVDQDRQLLLVSRHAPLDWNWMTPALRSRIEGGLTIPVVPPALDTQRQMLHELANSHALTLDADALLPARKVQRTYPQIQQTVLQVLHQVANPAVESLRPATAPQKDSLLRIAKLVARQSQLKLADVLGPSRRQRIVRARGVAIYLARTLLRISFDDLGEYFGGRDHTTMLHAWRTTTARLETDPRFKHEVHKLLVLLGDNFEVHS